MFDPLTPARLVGMLGELLRESARWDRPLDEFRTSQLLSASSVARYLSAELAGAEPNRSWFTEQAVALVAAAREEATAPSWREALDRAHTDLVVGHRPLGEVTAEVARAARAAEDPAAAVFSDRLRRLLAELVDRHVALLTAGEPR